MAFDQADDGVVALANRPEGEGNAQRAERCAVVSEGKENAQIMRGTRRR